MVGTWKSNRFDESRGDAEGNGAGNVLHDEGEPEGECRGEDDSKAKDSLMCSIRGEVGRE